MLKVFLRHPFPGHLEYTGFDVRGIVVFKGTDYMKTWNYSITTGPSSGYDLMPYPLFNYSDQGKGGAALLNPDGYTFYLNPLLEYVPKHGEDPQPILNYSKGKYAPGGNPDCTVNPYILFSDGSLRRLFKTTDFMSRTFHIKPPAGGGAFEFGYVVSACWAHPTITPVTNPETDFPVWANCEDPWGMGIEQLQPINYSVIGKPLFKVTIKHRSHDIVDPVRILVPSLSTASYYDPYNNPINYWGPDIEPEYTNIIDDVTTEVTLRIKSLDMGLIGDGLVPGNHLGILQVQIRGQGTTGGTGPYPTQLIYSIGVMPVNVYVEL
jgi:hypothetical protein